jgi:hypothetical protein
MYSFQRVVLLETDGVRSLYFLAPETYLYFSVIKRTCVKQKIIHILGILLQTHLTVKCSLVLYQS